VILARLATVTGRPEADVREILERPNFVSLTYRDETGIVGFGGLAVRKMHHRLTVDGRQLYTWCAWDSLFIPPILGQRAEVASPCPTTGKIVRVVLDPKGVESIEPEAAVMSFLTPETSAFDGDVQQTMSSFCHFVYFFASPDAATSWIENHTGTIVMSIRDGFRLGELLNETRWGVAPGHR
jgi:alkylmercury lyase